MKRILFLLAAALCLLPGGLKAQVGVSVNGGGLLPLDPSGGLYFTGDTLSVVSQNGTSAYPLSEVERLTFTVQTSGIGAATPEASLALYPTVTRDGITVQGVGATPQKALLYNLQGAVVRELLLTDGERVSVSNLPAGEYFVRCAAGTARFVKL